MDGSATHELRRTLVRALVDQGVLRSRHARAAMLAVPRHLFAPWLTIEDAYRDRAFPIPSTTSDAPATLSQPWAVALMLEAFDLGPGMKVLEVGAGTGYNAALLAHCVGPGGDVVTIDIEEHLVRTADERLRASGADRVRVRCRDGSLGSPEDAPFDRIVATVGLWEIPWAWRDQLSPRGCIVAPLHLGGAPHDHVLVRLWRNGDGLVGNGIEALAMVVVRGEGAPDHSRAATRAGTAWRGARVDQIGVTILPKGSGVHPTPHQKLFERGTSLVVIERAAPSDP